jgi:phage baseplate assembly protein W
MGTYSFKSSGKTSVQKVDETPAETPLPIGIVTPLRLGDQHGFLAMHTSLADQMHDNLRNLLLTNWGSRLGQFDLGGNLRPLLSEFTTQDDFDTQAIERIRSAVGKWMSFISLNDFSSVVDHVDNKHTGTVLLTITYDIPLLNVKGRKLLLTLYVM